jgi:hypothetical protein
LAQQLASSAQQALASENAEALMGAFLPQHALASAQHLAPCRQHSCTAEQQPMLSAQHLRPLAQQPSLIGAGQQALALSLQQASFFAQQSCGSAFFSAAGAATKATPMVIINANNLVSMDHLPAWK